MQGHRSLGLRSQPFDGLDFLLLECPPQAGAENGGSLEEGRRVGLHLEP